MPNLSLQLTHLVLLVELFLFFVATSGLSTPSPGRITSSYKYKSTFGTASNVISSNAVGMGVVRSTSQPMDNSLWLSANLHRCRLGTSLSSTSSRQDGASNDESSLLFFAKKRYLSEPIKNDEDDDIKTKLASFLQEKGTIQTLLGGASENEVIKLPSSSDLLDQWTLKSEMLGAKKPTSSDAAYMVTTDGIQFPGLKLVTKAYIGTSLALKDPSSFPELQLVFIKDEQFAEGFNRWIFNKLTGGKKRSDEGGQSTSSISRISATTDGVESGYRFSVDTQLQVNINFPAILLRILPVSKSKAEEQGSLSLEKLLDKDFNAVLPRLASQMIPWMEKFDMNQNMNI